MWHCRRIPLHQQYARCILMCCTSPDTQETGLHAALPRGAHLRARRAPGLLFKARRLREPAGPGRAPPTKLRAAPAPPAPPQPQGGTASGAARPALRGSGSPAGSGGAGGARIPRLGQRSAREPGPSGGRPRARPSPCRTSGSLQRDGVLLLFR